MRAGQREAGRGVVECRPLPTGHAVADGTIGREPHCCVVGIGRLLIVRQVTGSAISRRPGVAPVKVACRTIKLGMCAQQCEAGKLCVVKRCSRPAIHVMADFAG